MKLKKDGSFKHFEGKEQIQMGLDLDNTHSIMSLLRNNIYSDPIKSWVREIYSNAVDAHARVNNTSDPIDVTIKTKDGAYAFIVRDYGPSMTKDVIANVYAKMGKSDKINGNTEMGGWGLGAKSPLAYTDHFWIETWTEEQGHKTYRKWVQYIDPSRVGAMSLLEEDEWIDGKTGTQVTIPFEIKDLGHVVNSLRFYLAYTDAKYNFKCEVPDVNTSVSKIWYSHYGSNWAMYIYDDRDSFFLSEKNSALVIVGDIPYRLDFKTLFGYFQHNMKDLWFIADNQRPTYIKDQQYNRRLFAGFLQCLKFHEFEITLPIGSVDLNASREDLQYTDRTCKYMFDMFYKMFLEMYQFVRIDLVEHPNFPEACITYDRDYSGGFKQHFLSEVLWSKEALHFSDNPPLFREDPSEEYNSYRLDTVYQNNTLKKKDVLRRGYTTRLNTGSVSYVFILQDTEYKNFSKFVKYYAQKRDSSEKYWVDYLCVNVKDYNKVYDWIKESTPTVKLSLLVEDFKNNAPATAGNRTAKGSFKTLEYAAYNARSRADGISSYFEPCEKDIEPSEEHYYILLDEWNSPPEFFIKGTGSCTMNGVLKTYLRSKGINRHNLVLAKKLTRNYKHDNWINLFDIITDDYNRYKGLYKKINLALLTVTLVERQLEMFKTYTEEEIDHPDSTYMYLQKFYYNQVEFLKSHTSALYLFNLVDPTTRQLEKSRYQSYLAMDSYDDLKFMGEDQEAAFSIMRMYRDYLDKVPLFKFHDHYKLRDYDIEREDWVEYINLLEREKNLYTKTSQEQKEPGMSEYAQLNFKLSNKYL